MAVKPNSLNYFDFALTRAFHMGPRFAKLLVMKLEWTKKLQLFTYASVVVFSLAAPVVADGQKQAVVFDIDGTLTPTVYAMNTPRDGAADAVNAYANAGFQIIYLSARIPLFQPTLGDWLVENGFPVGTLHLTKTAADQDDHGAFKARVLADYASKGWMFVAAFGDSSSDFDAYAQAGIPTAHVFALRRFGAWDCKRGLWQGCFGGWDELIPLIQANIAE